MRRIVTAGVLLVAGAELLAVVNRDRGLILIVAGAAVAVALFALRWQLGRDWDTGPDERPVDEAAESLRRWLSRTETLISRSDSTRSDWDRYLRPMLARQFEMATGQKRTKDRAAYHATGRILFGAELWDWVNPENVTRGGVEEPGPGREALDEILQRLQRI